jgi:hypothetical protein
LTTLAIAGWRIAIECGSTWVDKRVREAYGPFLVPDEGVCEAAVAVMLDPALPGGNWKQFPVIRQGDVCALDVPGACGIIGLNSLQASLRLGVEAFEVALELFLEVFCAYLAFRLGGMLVHGAALLLDGKAHLFVGLGGRGKSSVVALSPHALALNDDLVVLRPVEGGWRAFGTPFWNPETSWRAGQTSEGSVVGIYSLAQDRRVYLEPLPVAVAASELVANCPVVNTDSLELFAVINRCRRLAEAVTVQRLHFRKDSGFWALLEGRNAN